MPDAHDIPMAIQWHEGMLLAPQHFQQQSIRNEDLLAYHLALAAPFHWGIKKYRINRTLLKEGVFRVREIEAVMPDGLLISYDEEDDEQENLQINLSPYDEEMHHSVVTVHLAVPVQKGGGASSVKGGLPRFNSLEGKPVADDNTGGAELSIPRLSPRLTLLVTDSPSRKYTSFPLSKVHYRDEMIQSTEFVPPLLQMAKGTSIWEMCNDLAGRLREKAYFLSEKLSAPSSQGPSTMLMENKFLILNIVSDLPRFESILATGRSHPYFLYLALTGIVGKIAALGAGLVPPVLSPYNHNDLYFSFNEAAGFIDRVISEAVVESHSTIVFKLENNIFSLDLKEEWITRRLVIGARARRGVDENQVKEWMNFCLIGSESQIESMKIRRLLGADRKKIDSDGDLIPPRGTILFAIETGVEGDDEFIRPDEQLNIFATSELGNKYRPSELILYVENAP